jgi:hypothetical protein
MYLCCLTQLFIDLFPYIGEISIPLFPSGTYERLVRHP